MVRFPIVILICLMICPAAYSTQCVGEHLRRPVDTRSVVKEVSTPSHWRVVVVDGPEPRDRTAGTPMYLCFFDPAGKLQVETEADLFVERLEAGRVLGTPSELVLLQVRGETGISQVSSVWLLPREGQPKRVLLQAGEIEKVVRSRSGRPGGLIISHIVGNSWRSDFWRWDEQEKSLAQQKMR